MSSFNEIGPNAKWNGLYKKHGTLVVNKSASSTSIQSSGSLELLDIQKRPIIQFNFEKQNIYAMQRYQILGMKHDQYERTLKGESITIRNKKSTLGMANIGVFGRKYFHSSFAPSLQLTHTKCIMYALISILKVNTMSRLLIFNSIQPVP